MPDTAHSEDLSQIIYDYLNTVDTIPEIVAKVPVMFEYARNETERAQVKSLCIEREKALGGSGNQVRSIFSGITKDIKAPTKVVKNYVNGDFVNNLEYTEKGEIKDTVSNFHSIMTQDERYSGIRFNALKNCAEVYRWLPIGMRGESEVTVTRWSDADEAESKEYIESVYGIYNDKKHMDALRQFFVERRYNPVLDFLKVLQWDGEERCENFLHQWALADDTPYIRECSRLIFAGGICRMMEPGCKMDDVIVLIGTQGSGKSTLVRFLAVEDEYFGEIKTIDGDKSTEQLEGKWICEIPELSAFTRAKEVESIKAFITRQKDNYRKPYDRNVDDRFRMCIMIGTTNNPSFLIDQTGNRRFYPVQTHSNGYEIYRHEKEIREYIKQCWAEALVKYRQGNMPNYANEELVKEYRKAQEAATQDDWRIGAIADYIADKPIGGFVCVKELMDEVISPDKEHPQNPSPKDSKELGIIMSRMEDWEKLESPKRTAKYGMQRGWIKKRETEPDEDDSEVVDNGGLPF